MSPICFTEVIFITAAMEVHEGRDVAVISLPGAFLHEKTEGKLAEMMAMVELKLYMKYVMTDH